MTVVLVTGSRERVDDVVSGLSSAGCRCLTAHDPDALREVVAGLGDERVDAYVQLPVVIEGTAGSAVGRVRELLTQGLLARFDAADIALGAVRDGGTVILVAGNSPGDRDLDDDQRARYALLRVLSHAILADSEGRGIRSIVLPAQSDPEAIVAAVLGGPSGRDRAIADFVAQDRELGYADWRVELLSIAASES